jgi:hypothetical protein
MPAIEVTRDAKHVPLPPIDPAVRIPDHIRKQTERANELLGQPQPEPAPAVVEPPAPAPAPVNEPTPANEPAPPAPAPAPVQTRPADLPSPSREELEGDSWAARYNSMKGRYEQSQRAVGSLQQQITELGDELVRTQQLLRAPQPQQPQNQPQRLLTEEDEATYGPELISMAQRAAMEALQPTIEALQRENVELKKGQNRTTGLTVNQIVDREVPEWRAISADPRWKDWLRKRDLYSNAVRGQLLERAYQAADAPRVVAFYKGFLQEEAATGQREPAPAQTEQPPVAPRQAAVPLETLAAPGRARPASGGTQAPADKPIFTHKQISEFYSNVRKGAYTGRQADKDRDEAAIFAAQREGRVRG